MLCACAGTDDSTGPGSASTRGSRDLSADELQENGDPSRAGAIPRPSRTLAGETVTTNASDYNLGDTIQVTFGGFPGNTYDWIAIALDGSPDGSYITYQYTFGAASGTLDFTGIGPGTYVARGHENNGNTVLASSAAFSVTGGTTSVTTDKANYTQAESAVVTYANMQGNARDWISIAPAGSSPTTYITYEYTGGGFGGTKTFPLAALPDGDYVARAYFNDSYTLAAESPVFHVGGSTVSTDKAAYAVGEAITVTWTNLAGNAQDWVSLAYQGSGATQYVQWIYTNGAASGQYTFTGLPQGTYVARAYLNNSYTIEKESAPFQVGSMAAVATDKTTYATTESAQVSFANAPGTKDWIAIALDGSPNGTYVQWQYTGDTSNGMLAFPLTSLASGTYVARLFTNDTTTLLATSPVFTVNGAAATTSVTPGAASYNFGEPVVINYTGMSGATFDWIGISAPGAAPGAYDAYTYTYGMSAGAAQFANLPPGTYVARAYFDNGNEVKATSTEFTVQGNTTCTTDKATYAAGETVVVTYTGMLGHPADWVSLSLPGSPEGSYVYWTFTGGGQAGSKAFDGVPAGTYVARCHFQNGNTVRAQSPELVVTP